MEYGVDVTVSWLTKKLYEAVVIRAVNNVSSGWVPFTFLGILNIYIYLHGEKYWKCHDCCHVFKFTHIRMEKSNYTPAVIFSVADHGTDNLIVLIDEIREAC